MRRSAYSWVIFGAAALNGMLLYFHYSWGATLSGYHVAEWSLDARDLGLLAALGFLPYALMQIPGGYLTDLLGVRRVMSGAMAGMAVGTGVFAAAPTFNMAVLGRSLIGVASGLVLLPSLKVLSRWFAPRVFATVQGAFLLLSAGGSIVATVPLASAAQLWGWRAPMGVVAALTALAALTSWGLLRNDPAETSSHAARDPAHATDGRISLRRGLWLWRRETTFWAVSLIFFASYGSLAAFQGLWAGPILRQVRGLTTTAAAEALFLITLGLGVGPLLFGFISDRVTRARKPVVVFSVIGEMAVWIVIIFLLDSLPLIWLKTALFALGLMAGGALVAQAMVAQAAPPAVFGTVFGIVNGWPFYGTAAIQLLAGFVLNALGPTETGSEPVYSAHSYSLALSPIVAFMLVAVLLSLRLPETMGSLQNGAA